MVRKTHATHIHIHAQVGAHAHTHARTHTQVSKLSRCLSERGLSIFYISAWDSDYVRVAAAAAAAALTRAYNVLMHF